MKLEVDKKYCRIVRDAVATMMRSKSPSGNHTVFELLRTGTIGTGDFIVLIMNEFMHQLRSPEDTPCLHDSSPEERLCALERMMDAWRESCDKNARNIRRIAEELRIEGDLK